MLKQWLWVILATGCAGVGSVWLAAWLNRIFFARHLELLLSVAAGTLLATALLLLLPEAFESNWEAHTLFTCLLFALIGFFLLDKAQLWHHGHEHHGQGHARVLQEQITADAIGHGDHEHGTGDHAVHAHSASWTLLLGDSLHCFSDGILIASAMLIDSQLGWLAAFAVLAHETPHHMGDLAIIQQGAGRRAAITKVSLAGTATVLGGCVGLWLLDPLSLYLPFFIVIACASFVYVALADLIPQLQKQTRRSYAFVQTTGLLLGVWMVWAVAHWGGRGH